MSETVTKKVIPTMIVPETETVALTVSVRDSDTEIDSDITSDSECKSNTD